MDRFSVGDLVTINDIRYEFDPTVQTPSSPITVMFSQIVGMKGIIESEVYCDYYVVLMCTGVRVFLHRLTLIPTF